MISAFQHFSISGFFARHFHQGRGGRAKLASSANLLAKVVAALVSFINVPIAVRYLGNEGYGLLTLVVSVIGWIQFSNLGLGLGLQNALTGQVALGNKRAQRELVSTTFFALLGISILLAVASAASFTSIPWERLFPPASARFVSAIPKIVALALGCFICSITCGFVQPIYAARQELHIYYISAMLASFASLAGLIIAVRLDWGLFGVAFANVGCVAACSVGFGLWTVFGRGLTELRPQWSSVTREAWSSIYRVGLGFLSLQFSSIAIFQCDAFIISRYLSVDQVTPYNIGQRVFAQFVGLLGIVFNSLWPAFGHAKAVGDVAWMRRIYRKVTLSYVAIYGLVFLIMAVFGHWLLALWVGAAAAPPALLITAIGVNYFLVQWMASHSLLLNGLGVIRKQAVMMVMHAALAVGLNLFLVQRLGSIGLAVGGTLAQLAVSAWYLPWLFHRTLAGLPAKSQTGVQSESAETPGYTDSTVPSA